MVPGSILFCNHIGLWRENLKDFACAVKEHKSYSLYPEKKKIPLVIRIRNLRDLQKK